MKGRQIVYTEAELRWLREHATLPAPELHAAFCAAFGRTDVCKVNLVAKRKRLGLSTGRTGRFAPGMTPANKGKAMPWNANSARTQFKKGGRSGKAMALHKPIGTERLSKEGYREIKIHDGLPLQSRWRALHLVNWEAVHEPIPKGMVLKCLDGNRLNCEPSNWHLIPRALLPRLAGGNRYRRVLAYDDAPPELKSVVLETAKLEYAVRKATRR